MKTSASSIQEFNPKDISFNWATQLSLENTRNCLPEIVNMLNGKKLVIEGDDHTRYRGFRGHFLILDGRTVEKMIADGTVPRSFIMPFRNIGSLDDAKKYMEGQPGDGAYFIDGSNPEQMRMAQMLGIYPTGRDAEKIFSVLPADFINFVPKDSLEQSPYKPGTKTIAAASLAGRYGNEGVRTSVVKGTPFGPLGTGTAAGFGPDGLEQRLFFVPDTSMAGYAISPSFAGLNPDSNDFEEIMQLAVLRSIVPVYQTFSGNGQKLESQVMLSVSDDGKILQAPYEIIRPVTLPTLNASRMPKQRRRTDSPFNYSCGGLFSEQEVTQLHSGDFKLPDGPAIDQGLYW